MKNLLKTGLLVIIIFESFSSFSQNSQKISYDFYSNTLRVFDVDAVLNFTKAHTYDEDFKESSKYIYSNLKVAIKIFKNGKGRIVFRYEGEDKITLDIEDCFKLKYNDSDRVYWKLKCKDEVNNHIDYHIEFKEDMVYRVWLRKEGSRLRVYHSN